MRTTIDLDPVILKELKQRQRAEGKSLSQLASELLAVALAQPAPETAPPFEWISRDLGAKVDFEDKDALSALLDAGHVDE